MERDLLYFMVVELHRLNRLLVADAIHGGQAVAINHA
jgi:hypothetical protein